MELLCYVYDVNSMFSVLVVIVILYGSVLIDVILVGLLLVLVCVVGECCMISVCMFVYIWCICLCSSV